MIEAFNAELWKEALTYPDWYLRVKEDFKRVEKSTGEKNKDHIKEKMYGLVEGALSKGTLPLASRGEDLDKERRPIDTVIIHHTKNQPGMTLARLNAMQLIRIYGMYYADPTDPQEKYFKGLPVWSNHFYGVKQVFWGYHWFIREDGKAERILEDHYVGWHAGNWNINTRSIGICIDDDLSHKSPSKPILTSIAEIIRQKYPSVSVERVLGHGEVNDRTLCPGDKFIDGWKDELRTRLRR